MNIEVDSANEQQERVCYPECGNQLAPSTSLARGLGSLSMGFSDMANVRSSEECYEEIPQTGLRLDPAAQEPQMPRVAMHEYSPGEVHRALLDLLKEHPTLDAEEFDNLAGQFGIATDTLSAELNELLLSGRVKLRGVNYEVSR